MKIIVSVYNNASDVYNNDYCQYQEFAFDEGDEERMSEFVAQMVIDHNKAVVVSKV